jgi:23S rRNA (uracil1939-C5)-methyltransferase
MLERLLIASIGHHGDGIAETASGPVFVPYSLPGETVEAGREGSRAEIVSIHKPSPDRIEPFCPHFGTCGGCAIQHWREDKYRAWKRDLVVTALSQAGIETEVGELIDAHGEGRRRATLHARRGGRQILTVGFSGRRSHTIVPIDACPIFAPSMQHAIPAAWKIAEALESAGKPLDLQFTAADNGLDVDVRGTDALKPKVLMALAAIAAAEKLTRITRHGELVAQHAEPFVRIGKATIPLPPGSFLQPTAKGEETLAALVLESAGKARHIADLFSGIGTFALRLAETARISAIDSDAAAIAALKRGAAMPGLKPVDAQSRDLFRRPFTAKELSGFDLAVLDPPRQGAEAQAREFATSKVEKIVYVSCNPASFARDARILLDAKFKLTGLTPVDQFKYSAHLELVGIFER